MKLNAPNEVDRAVPCPMVKLGGEAARYWRRPRRGRSALRVFAFVLLLAINAAAAEQPLAQSTIVLYNKTVPDSVSSRNFTPSNVASQPTISFGLLVRSRKKSAAKITM